MICHAFSNKAVCFIVKNGVGIWIHDTDTWFKLHPYVFSTSLEMMFGAFQHCGILKINTHHTCFATQSARAKGKVCFTVVKNGIAIWIYDAGDTQLKLIPHSMFAYLGINLEFSNIVALFNLVHTTGKPRRDVIHHAIIKDIGIG